ncbi:MarR family winged helix-turn-helix transcriptional regulator [Bifidobacterium subtile]|uniref:Transcriptional regulator, MarR family n=1 Tax=Bifidobacterium subtile TaxID=77635 RepID=A0A087EBK2_9BIFI|nr:MarR family transcriptional regulator [Bifidobacterium subtile]KFJ05153.1 transcriptional regulator, MarR family [Bifidobacterium subtile]QOL36559.1 MarR family transcriptional regulator [Bifidobacterium subtile]
MTTAQRTENAPKPQESRELARLVVQAATNARQGFAKSAGGFGIPITLCRALLLLDEPRSMRHIAEQLGCDPSYVTSLVDQLTKYGLATRTTGSDRRVKLISATDTGVALRTRLAAAVSGDAAFGRQLTAEQRAQLKDLLMLLLRP